MKNILFILLCVFSTSLFSQTSKKTISEKKCGLLTCKNFSETNVETDETSYYVYCSFQNTDYQHIVDIGSFMMFSQSSVDEKIEQLENCVKYMDNKSDSFSYDDFRIYDFSKNMYIYDDDKSTWINKKNVIKLIEWLKLVDMGE